MASVTDDLHSGLHSPAQCLPELRMRPIIWQNSVDPVHLDHKDNLTVISYFGCGSQFV